MAILIKLGKKRGQMLEAMDVKHYQILNNGEGSAHIMTTILDYPVKVPLRGEVRHAPFEGFSKYFLRLSDKDGDAPYPLITMVHPGLPGAEPVPRSLYTRNVPYTGYTALKSPIKSSIVRTRAAGSGPFFAHG